MSLFVRLLKDESGATAIEYGLIAALIAVAIIGALTLLGPEVAGTFSDVQKAVADGRAAGTSSGGGTTP